MRKRILSVLIGFLVCVCSFLSPAVALPVNATALPIPAGAEIESLMILWDLLMSGMLVSGADPDAFNYESECALFDAFMHGLMSVGGGDGSTFGKVTYSVNGTFTEVDVSTFAATLELPEEEVWEMFRVIDGGGSGNTGSDQEPEGPYEEIDSFTVNGAFFTYVADWIKSLWDGDVEGLDPNDYYFPSASDLPQYQFKGDYEQDSDGNYVIKGSSIYNRFQYRTFDIYGTSESPVAAYLKTDSSNQPCIWFVKLYGSDSLTGAVVYWTETFYDPNTGSFMKEMPGNGTHLNYNEHISVNIPLFESSQAALTYLQGQALESPLNGLNYDHASLAMVVPSALSPLADTAVDPNVLPAVNAAICNAVETLPQPEPALDPAINTQAFAQTVTDAVADVVPQVAPDTGTEVLPELDPEANYELEKYKFDLTQVFPFCLPFDMIRLLDTLAAEPQAPQFEIPFVVPALGIEEYYTIDLSFLDSVAEVIRICELVAFVFFLISTTSKLIKW